MATRLSETTPLSIVGWNPPLERVVGTSTAAGFLGVDKTRLQELVRRGLVEVTEWRDHGGGRKAPYAPLQNWIEGWRRWETHQRRDLLSRSQAARKLGISVKVAARMVCEGYVQGVRTSEGVKAPLEAWKAAYERYRLDHPVRRRMERRRVEGAVQAPLRANAGPEEVARRVAELREREFEFRVFVLAVKQGLPLSDGFFARLREGATEDATFDGAYGEAAARTV